MTDRLLPPVPADAPVPTATSRSNVRALLKGGAGGVVLGVVIATAFIRIDKETTRRLMSGIDASPMGLLLPVLALFVVILLHELGHVIGGLLVGFRFELLVVGPFRLYRAPSDRLRLGWNRDLASGGGLAALHPRDTQDLPRRFGWLVAAGPIASVLLALAAGVGAATDSGAWLRSFLAVTSLGSAGIALATLVPMQTGYYLTDGARLLQLWRGGPAATRDAALLSLLALSVRTDDMSTWPLETIVDATAPSDGSIFELQGRSFAYMYALARQAPTDADAQLRRALDITAGLPPVIVASLRNERAYMDAMYGADHATLDTHTATFAGDERVPGLPVHELHRVRASLAAARGDTEGARRELTTARALIRESATSGTAFGLWTQARLDDIEARLS